MYLKLLKHIGVLQLMQLFDCHNILVDCQHDQVREVALIRAHKFDREETGHHDSQNGLWFHL